MKSIVVLSGKGGVGKSSITASIATIFSKDKNLKIVCADCDVDASNLSLLFSLTPDKYKDWEKLSTNRIAIIDESKCTKCGKCVDTCYFNALSFKGEFPSVSKFSCEGCNACELICPAGAITLHDVFNAKIGFAETKYGFKIASAQLEPGNSGSGKLVASVKKKAMEVSSDAELLIIDSAAGIGCPVIASVTGNDYAVLVTEPTPSGFSDLKKALAVVNHFRIPCGIIINKFDLSLDYSKKIEIYAKNNRINILGHVPFDKEFVKAMVEMIPIVDYTEKYVKLFNDIKEKIKKEIWK